MDQRHCCENVRIVLIVRNRAVPTCERVSVHTIAHVVRDVQSQRASVEFSSDKAPSKKKV